MKLRTKGFIAPLIALAILIAVSVTGYYIYHRHQSALDQQLAAAREANASQQNDFPGCVREGGTVRSKDYIDVATAPTGVYTDGLQCFRTSNSTGDVADVKICQDDSDMECHHINDATYPICQEMVKNTFGLEVQPGKAYAKLQHYAAITSDYARVDIMGCGREGSSQVTPPFIVFYKYPGQLPWQEVTTTSDPMKCTDVDGQHIPLELAYSCVDSRGTTRVPKN